MLKLYCQTCGALNAYIAEKPNFCQKCGKGMGEVKAKVTLNEDNLINEDNDMTKGVVKFDLSELDVEIGAAGQNANTVGGLAGTVEGGQLLDSRPEGVSAPDYTMDDFKKEAGSIRGGNEPEET